MGRGVRDSVFHPVTVCLFMAFRSPLKTGGWLQIFQGFNLAFDQSADRIDVSPAENPIPTAAGALAKAREAGRGVLRRGTFESRR